MNRTIALIVASVAAAIALNAAFTLYVTITSQHRWCKTLTLLDTADRHHPATSPTGRAFYADLHQLRGNYGCG